MAFKTVQPLFIALHGDSKTESGPLCGLTFDLDDSRRWQNKLLTQWSTNMLGRGFICRNFGVGGKRLWATTGGALTVFTTDLANTNALCPPGYLKIVRLLFGANDLADSRTAAQIYADTITLVNNWKAAGYIVVQGTPTSRANLSENAIQTTVAASIRAGHADRSLASDVLADYKASPYFDENTDALNNTHNMFVGDGDTVHPNANGIVQLSLIDIAAILYWLENGTPT